MKFTPEEIQRFEARRKAESVVSAPQASTPAPKKGRSGWARWLPTALGVGATLAAAPLTGGASLAGTAAILGGSAAVGAGLGEFGAQKMSGEKTDLGKIAKEAAFSGVTGAIPIGGAAKAAKVARASKVAKEVGEEAVEEVVKKGFKSRIAEAGKGLVSRTQGTQTGAVMKGGQRVTPKLEKEVTDYLNVVAPKGTPKDKLIAVAADKQATGQRISEAVKAGNRSVTVDDLGAITGKVQKSGITAKNLNTETTKAYRAAISESKTLKDLQKIKGELDDELANFYKRVDAGTATKAEERALKGYRDGINDILKKVDGYADANKTYSTAVKAEEMLLRAPKSSNARLFGVDIGVGGASSQKAKVAVGQAMQNGIKLPTGTGLTSRVLREGVKQEVGGAVGNSMFPSQVDPMLEQPPIDPSLLEPTPEDIMSIPDATEDEYDPYAPQNLRTSVSQIMAQGGEYKDVKEFLATAQMLNELEALGQPQEAEPLSATAAESVAGAQAGLDSINLLKEEMIKNPNVRAKTAIPGRGVAGGVGNALLGTSNYQAAFGNILDSWARIKTGAAISNTEEARFNANLPEPFDPPETVEKKLKIIGDLFTAVVNRTGKAGNDTEAAIMGEL